MRPLVRRGAVLALFAMLWLALAPVLTPVFATAGDAAGWVEVCTGDGLQRIPLAQDEVPPPSDHVAEHVHCASCPPQQTAAPLLPAAARLPGDARLHERPLPLLRSPRIRPLWRRAAARGPPSYS